MYKPIITVYVTYFILLLPVGRFNPIITFDNPLANSISIIICELQATFIDN